MRIEKGKAVGAYQECIFYLDGTPERTTTDGKSGRHGLLILQLEIEHERDRCRFEHTPGTTTLVVKLPRSLPEARGATVLRAIAGFLRQQGLSDGTLTGSLAAALS